jgi:hypothetical protein
MLTDIDTPSGLVPVAEDDPYPRYPPGWYIAECVGGVIYFDPRFNAIKCRLDFKLLFPDASRFPNEEITGKPISAFFHLGRGKNSRAGRGSRYYRAWAIANSAPPRKRQALSLRVFKGKSFLVQVDDTRKNWGGKEHPAELIYSTIKEILERRP